MAQIMISLLGGRPLPNLQAVLHLTPDRLYIVASRDGEESYRNMKEALPPVLKDHQAYFVDPYVLQETLRICREIVRHHPDDEITVVSASEPKVMTLGAYDFVRELGAQGRSVRMLYVSRDGLVDVLSDAPVPKPIPIGLEQYFRTYGWQVRLKQGEDPQLDALVGIFAQDLLGAHKVIHALRDEVNRQKKAKTYRPGGTLLCKDLGEGEVRLLEALRGLGFVQGMRWRGGQVEVALDPDREGLLLSGVWLEYHVYREARRLTDDGGRPIFDECAWGVEDRTGKGEIDFVGLRGGQLVIASCKTVYRYGGKEDRRFFEELHSKAEQLGGRMCSKVFVTSLPKGALDEQQVRNYEAWAERRQIVLVMGEDLPRVGAILRKVALGRKEMEPEEVPVYSRI